MSIMWLIGDQKSRNFNKTNTRTSNTTVYLKVRK